MKRDKLWQHQKARLNRILHSDGMWMNWGKPTAKGQRVINITYAACLRSIARFANEN